MILYQEWLLVLIHMDTTTPTALCVLMSWALMPSSAKGVSKKRKTLQLNTIFVIHSWQAPVWTTTPEGNWGSFRNGDNHVQFNQYWYSSATFCFSLYRLNWRALRRKKKYVHTYKNGGLLKFYFCSCVAFHRMWVKIMTSLLPGVPLQREE